MRKLTKGIVAGLVMAVLVVLAGCGSGGSGTAGLVENPQQTGNLHIAVKFPSRDGVTPENLPLATDSVHITVKHQGSMVAEDCLARPAANGGPVTVTFTATGVPAGDNTVTANAYQSSDCTGTIVATCSAVVNVIAGQTNTVTLTAEPLVIRGEAYVSDGALYSAQEPMQVPGPITAMEMGTGDTVDVYTLWYDIDDNQMLPDDVTWASTDDTVATVVADPLDSTIAEITGEFADTGSASCQITATATPAGQEVAPAQMGGSMPSPEVTIDVTVHARGDLEVIVE